VVRVLGVYGSVGYRERDLGEITEELHLGYRIWRTSPIIQTDEKKRIFKWVGRGGYVENDTDGIGCQTTKGGRRREPPKDFLSSN